MSYHAFWSLRTMPFGASPLGRQFYSAPPQREAFARLHYLVAHGHSVGLISGPGECGRSALLREVASSRGFGDIAIDVALTACAHQPAHETLAELAVQLGASPLGGLWQRIGERITASARQQVRTLWLIDDINDEVAQLAGALLSQNRWLTVLATARDQQVSGIAGKLGSCPLRIELAPFALRDTMAFVRHRLSEAGATRPIFTDSALVRLHELSDGHVGRIIRYAELAMTAAAAQGATEIAATWVDTAREEFVRAA